jgi:GNAT superfamily N-acetyltransferase
MGEAIQKNCIEYIIFFPILNVIKGGIYVYIRKWIQSKDEPHLVKMITDNFEVKPETAKGILRNAKEVFVACISNGNIVGFSSYRFRLGDTIFNDYIVFDSNYQGKGIATSFVPSFEDYFLKQGIRTIYSSVDEGNTEALRVFKRWGYKVTGKVGSSIIIEKHLSPTLSSADPLLNTKLTTGFNQSNKSSYVRKLNSSPYLR